jgi:CheY-like chemotaxis protein
MEIKVLSVDKDSVVLATLKKIFDNEFTQTSTRVNNKSTNTIRQALELFEQSLIDEEPYDLIFIDLTLEDKYDGIDLIPVFKTHSPVTRVVVITGVVINEDLQSAKKVGADGFIRKPISGMTLKIKDMINRTIKFRELEKEFKSARVKT